MSLQTSYHRRTRKSIPNEGAATQYSEHSPGIRPFSVHYQPRTETRAQRSSPVSALCGAMPLRKAPRELREKSSLADPACKELVRKLITEQQWSPEEIAARLKHEGNPVQVSYGAIYRAIHAGLLDGPRVNGHIRKASRFSTNLRRKGKKYRRTGEAGKHGQFVIQHHLKDRPEEANNRTVIGHFEGDTVAGKRGSDSLVTLTDRCSRFTLAAKVPNREAETVRDKIIALLSQLPDGIAKSVTPDRGKEFARYQEVTDKLPQVTFYFPPPYSPWERGTNENTNGLLREYFPKYQDIAPVSEIAVLEAVEKLNTRPRKCLGWKTPYEVFFDCVLHLT